MAKQKIRKNNFFLDSSYIIALLNPRDKHHALAVSYAIKLKAKGARLITTQQIIIEISNFFSKRRFRADIVRLIDTFEQDPHIEVVSFTDELYYEALEFYRHHSDKDWGLTDCLSFVVMDRFGLKQALTADVHFTQAGFEALLRV